MKKYFYSDLAKLDVVLDELGKLSLDASERKELEELAHEHLHQVILDAILTELSLRDKKIFLANLEYEEDEKIWKHLNDKVENIEEKISKAAESLKSELVLDIKTVK
jgi:hypothetical protein